jgi:carbamoyltransferase
MRTAILGISAFYHDSAAAIIVDGEIIAAAQEERFTRRKHDPGFPARAIRYVLDESGVPFDKLTAIAFYDKPFLKFERLLETYHAFVPKGVASFIAAIPVWLKEKLFMRKLLRDELKQFGKAKIPLLFPEHHLSHAASAFYPSPFEEAAILTIDGVGEWATTTLCHGRSGTIRILKEQHFPHSTGLLYSSFTYYLGFKVNSGEYKVMGLAPYGDATSPETITFREKILSTLVDVREDGSVLLNMDYFDFATGLTMTNNMKWERLFGFPRREPESAISLTHMNFAIAVQEVIEIIVVALARTVQQLTQCRNLVLAGGVALNCVANTKIANAGIVENIWIQPAAGDAGGALGAAYAAYHIGYKMERRPVSLPDSMKGACLGPSYSDKDILKTINSYEASYTHFDDFNECSSFVSERIAEGKVIGWFQGRMEFGPRALGNRSILADPRNPEMQKRINQKIKVREEFRPFAPSVLIEDLSRYYKTATPSPYMLLIAMLKDTLRRQAPENELSEDLTTRLSHTRSDLPAVTHVDHSSRIQTVSKDINPRFWQLINDFKKITGQGILINTSFNRRGEPIVCTPEDAWLCFMRTELDYLVMGNYVFDKLQQTPLPEESREKLNFEPD